MEPFEPVDISGDAGIKAYGASLEEVFVNAAVGMYSLITDLDAVGDRKNLAVSLESHSREGLLVSWLNELIFHFDAYGFIGKRVHIKMLSDNRIEAEVWGEEFEPRRHESKLLIKAATYHRLRIEKVGDVWEAEVIFDI